MLERVLPLTNWKDPNLSSIAGIGFQHNENSRVFDNQEVLMVNQFQRKTSFTRAVKGKVSLIVFNSYGFEKDTILLFLGSLGMGF